MHVASDRLCRVNVPASMEYCSLCSLILFSILRRLTCLGCLFGGGGVESVDWFVCLVVEGGVGDVIVGDGLVFMEGK